MLLLNGVLFFLAGSLWGARASARAGPGHARYLVVFAFDWAGAAFKAYDDPRCGTWTR